MKSAILLIAFNRPEETTKCLERIFQYNPTKLYVACDGPRENNHIEKEKVDKVRAILNNAENHVTHLKTNFSDKNLGCKIGVKSAIDWFFTHEEEGIILEDDILAERAFFEYCEILLSKYRHNDKVGLISGYNPGYKEENNYSYYFSIYPNIWGWATWKNSWYKSDIELREWDTWKESKQFRNLNSINRHFTFYWTDMIDSVANGKTDTWDFPWFYSCWKSKMLCCIPKSSLVSNIGFNERGTHTNGKSPSWIKNANQLLSLGELKHPKEPTHNVSLDRYLSETMFQISILTTLKWKIRRIPLIGDILSKTKKMFNSNGNA